MAIFPICSVTKHFTNASILMLEEEGKLSIDDDINRYLLDLPPQFKGIKIKHLIFHISGIPDYLSDPATLDTNQMLKQGKKLTARESFNLILKFQLRPYGKTYAYSNSGYLLLTQIIEKVSGQSYAQFIQERIFNKFDMKNAFVMSAIDLQHNYAQPHLPWPLYTPTNWMKVYIMSGEGGIFMSINDFEKWINAFERNKIFAKKQTMKKFLSIGKYDDGKEVAMDRGRSKYGFGLAHGEDYANGKTYSIMDHAGGMTGSAALFSNVRDDSENIWVVYLNNAGSHPTAFSILEQVKIQF